MKSDFDTAHPFMLEAGLGDIEARDLWVDAEPLCDAAQLQSARTLISAASASAAGNPKRGRPAVIQQVIPQIVHVDPRHAVSFSHATFQTLRREYASYGRTRCRALAMAAARSQPPASGPAFPIPAISLSTYLLEYISIIVLHHASKEAP